MGLPMTMQEDRAERPGGDAQAVLSHRPTLGRSIKYVKDVVAELAENGIVQKSSNGQPQARVSDTRSAFGVTEVTVETDMRPIGLSVTIPLRATFDPDARLDPDHPDRQHIRWHMHSIPITTTPADMNPVEAASELTPERLNKAYQQFLGPRSQERVR